MGDDRASSKPTSSRSGEVLLSMQELIQMSVENAVSKVLDDSDKHASRFDCRGELSRMADAIQDGFGHMNKRVDGLTERISLVNEALASGATKFAVMDVEHRHLRSSVEALVETSNKRDSSLHRTRGSVQPPTSSVEKEEAPLISPKVWNALLLAILTSLGAGIGALAWDKIRGPDRSVVAPPAAVVPAKQVQQQQGP